MDTRKFWLAPIKGYQYISKMLPASCRYYPTCSEYAKWQFEFNAPHKALLASSLRILRCNQLFDGGIDYPIVTYVPPKLLNLLDFNRLCGKMKIIYWFVPKDINHSKYYILKDFNAINDSSDS
ncbi:membrane protein insertion efficiency factor YidD [Sulfurovum sp. CS9]|uniref:membrane protein insertion efficiency factor YidD n=1 Tax=Sulfurovum sp. CS9 TaxID=3391146 RepID=UPI0039EA92CB